MYAFMEHFLMLGLKSDWIPDDKFKKISTLIGIKDLCRKKSLLIHLINMPTSSKIATRKEGYSRKQDCLSFIM